MLGSKLYLVFIQRGAHKGLQAPTQLAFVALQ